MLDHKILRLSGDLFINAIVIVPHLHLGLSLLKHTQFQTSDLVLNVLVVFLKLAIMDDLTHKLLQFIVIGAVVMLLLRMEPGHLALTLLLLLLTIHFLN